MSDPYSGMRVHFRAVRAATFRSVHEPERPSKRLVEQRLRNRAMEALVAFSEGDAGVRSVGVSEYVEQFFDTVNDDSPWTGATGRVSRPRRSSDWTRFAGC
jgi:hypothetical protein